MLFQITLLYKCNVKYLDAVTYVKKYLVEKFERKIEYMTDLFLSKNII